VVLFRLLVDGRVVLNKASRRDKGGSSHGTTAGSDVIDESSMFTAHGYTCLV
jgi:hypothetical protein